MTTLDILYEDNHLLVVNKPAGIATMGAESGPTIHSMAADYLKTRYHKPGRAYVGIVSRLDAMTSGVLVLARTSKAAARLSAQFAERTDHPVTKIYLAAVAGPLEPDAGELIDFVRKDDSARRMRVVDRSVSKSQRAHLRYQTVARNEEVTIVAIQLLTGRKHQIRVQFSAQGHPVVGDRKYDSTLRFSAGVALHSYRLQIMHPTRREPMWFQADLPRSWNVWQRLLPEERDLRKLIDPLLNIPGGDGIGAKDGFQANKDCE